MVDRYRLKSLRLHFQKGKKLEVQEDANILKQPLLPERQEEEYFEGFLFINVLQELYIREEKGEIKAPAQEKKRNVQRQSGTN